MLIGQNCKDLHDNHCINCNVPEILRFMLKNTAIALSDLGSSRLQVEDGCIASRKLFSIYLVVQSGAL